jgi:hypothetical protein
MPVEIAVLDASWFQDSLLDQSMVQVLSLFHQFTVLPAQDVALRAAMVTSLHASHFIHILYFDEDDDDDDDDNNNDDDNDDDDDQKDDYDDHD